MRPSRRKKSTPAADARYSAPALEKGLDILELLADQSGGMTQKQIAAQLGRSTSEIFRMLACLQRRGYVHRARPADTYHLTMRLFELARRHHPTRTLLEAALPVMRRLAGQIRQSCHLAVPHDDRILIIAQTDSPDSRGFAVRLGATLSLTDTASGGVVLAFASEEFRQLAIQSAAKSPPERAALLRRLQQIRRRGCESSPSRTIAGITDLSSPVIGDGGTAIAALSVPFLTQLDRPSELQTAQRHLAKAAAEISQSLGGQPVVAAL